MELILWRHAEAEDLAPGMNDSQRRLTPRGQKQARETSAWLRAHLPKRTRILVSPTERTQGTAHALQCPYEIEAKVGVGETARSLLGAAQWPKYEGAVLVIGHQPTLGRVAALLLSGHEDDWAVKKSGVWWFSRRERDTVASTVLRAVINPGFL